MNKFHVLIATIILAIGIFAAKYYKAPDLGSKNTLETKEATSLSPSPAVETKNWQEYSDKDLGITFNVPENFEVDKSGSYSVLAGIKNESDKSGMPRFFYVSVVPESYVESDVEVIYNYNTPDFTKLTQISVGSKVSLSYNENQAQWFTYERLGDETINGKVAKVYINRKPWEFPEGTEEFRYIFDSQTRKVIAGGYIDGPQSNGLLPQAVFDQIIKSLKFE